MLDSPFAIGPFTTGALLLALVVYFWAMVRVGRARGRFGVVAPAVTGAPEFERAFRAQQNTVEQMVAFVPLLAIAGLLWGDRWAGSYGLIWSAGRLIYIETYVREASRRSLGFLLSAGVSMGVLVALVITLIVRLTTA